MDISVRGSASIPFVTIMADASTICSVVAWIRQTATRNAATIRKTGGTFTERAIPPLQAGRLKSRKGRRLPGPSG